MNRARAGFLLLAGLCAAAGGCRAPVSGGLPAGGTATDSMLIGQDIAFLAADALEGRRTGTPGNDSAAAYLARRYAALRLAPVPNASGCGAGCAASYLLRFTAYEPVRGATPRALPTQNIAGIVPGTDPLLRDQYVVIGAHFDHLGRSTEGAMDPDAGPAIRNGADDNASGSAAVLALARRFAIAPAKRSILVVHFSGEEEGLLGSEYFVAHSPVPLGQVDAMVNFDMVGRLRDRKLIIYGLATAKEMDSVIAAANESVGLRVSLVGDGFGPSDHSSFYAKDIPVLHFFTDVHPDYHRATDDVDKVNIAGEVQVVDLAERAIRDIADRPARLTFTKAATAQRTVAPGNGGAYFGSIPDMGASDGDGMRISGVSPGGPAEKAGLKGGDLIVEFGGHTVKNIYDYTDAISAYKPGDDVTVVLLRGSSRERVTLTVTLGRRGG